MTWKSKARAKAEGTGGIETNGTGSEGPVPFFVPWGRGRWSARVPSMWALLSTPVSDVLDSPCAVFGASAATWSFPAACR